MARSTSARQAAAPAPASGRPNAQWPDGHPRRRQILLVLCLSLLVVVIDNTILNTALPTLARTLHAGTSGLQWIADAYTLCFAALLIPAGALGDRYGRKLSLLGGLAVFALGSTLAAFAGRHRHADRGPRGDGPGRGVRHARHAVHPELGVPAPGAAAGHRGLVGGGRGRHRDRPDPGRPAAVPLLVGQRVPDQRPAGRGGAGRRAADRAGDRRAVRPPAGHPGHAAGGGRTVPAGGRHHRGAQPGLDRPGHAGRGGRRAGRCWPASPGGSCASRIR